MPIATAATATVARNGSMTRVEQNRELQFARHARVIAGVQGDERPREDDPGGDERRASR